MMANNEGAALQDDFMYFYNNIQCYVSVPNSVSQHNLHSSLTPFTPACNTRITKN